MKQQSFSRSTKSKIQDPKLDNDGRKRLSSKSKQPPSCEAFHRKPLTGRIFYLDLPCNKRSQSLESDIKSLGGTVEKFFSKEIRYLVSSKPEARHVQRLIQDSPVPSPDSGLSSPHPASRRDSHGHRGSSQGPADTVVVSRGKSLVEKVVKEQERFQMNRILANALEWGVKIIYIDDIISYIDKKKTQLPKVSTVAHTVKAAAQPDPTKRTAFQKSSAGRISRPFVKVEDSSRHYRPIYLPMANMPVFNFKSAVPCSPFLVEENDDAKTKKQNVHGSGGDRGAKVRKDRRRGHEGKVRRKGGYCECCLVKYDSLKAHLQSERHQSFSKSAEYLVVDKVISGLTCELIHISTPKRVKCSVSSPVLAPGAVVKKEGEEGVLEVKNEKTTGFPPWSSHNTEFSSGTPQPVRKRCREYCRSPGEDAAEQSEALEKSQSKRGSFEWGSSSHTALHTPLSCTKNGCFSDSLERNRRSLQVNSKQRTSLGAQPAHQHVRSLQSMTSEHKPENMGTRSTWKTQGANVASEPSGISRLNFQTSQKSLLDTTCMQVFKEKPQPNSSHMPVKTEHPSDANHDSVTAERSLSSRGIEPDNKDSPSRTLRRKVRNSRRRRKVSAEASQGLSGKDVKVLISQTCKVSESQSISASALDLWQLFMSTDADLEDDFKGFYE
ncbi:protein DBF4 homolog A [Salminus brasiliensis]|uniref:protein DBF4 homolog A n=1 Tax=Salminus brasiliensis TaxID=930266 RepID=UPI003B82F57F